MHRLTEFKHDIIRDIDDIIDRPDTDRNQTVAQPLGRGLDLDTGNRQAKIAGAKVFFGDFYPESGVITVDPDIILAIFTHILDERRIEKNRDLPGHAIMPPEIRTIGNRLIVDFENIIIESEISRKEFTELGALAQVHYPAMIITETELILCAEHALRLFPADLGRFDLEAVGQDRAYERDRHHHTDSNIGRAANNPELFFPDIDQSDLKLISLRMLAYFQDSTDHDLFETARLIHDSIDLDRMDSQPVTKLACLHCLGDFNEILQPFIR